MSGAVLQHGSVLSGSPPSVTLNVGGDDSILCLELKGPVPDSIEWYDPQGQLVLDSSDEVYQAPAAGGRASYLYFQSYQQSHGGKYECRVNVSGKNLEKLPVCIGECYTLDGCRINVLNRANHHCLSGTTQIIDTPIIDYLSYATGIGIIRISYIMVYFALL